MADLGRQVKYGIGKEATAGTPVAAAKWLPQLSFTMKNKSDYLTNTSAFGRIERTNSSDINRKWSEGSLEAKLTDVTGGYILLGAFGSVVTTANADASTVVKNHTFNINQDINGQSLTFIRKDSISTQAFALGRVGEWKLSMVLDDYVKVTADAMAKAGEDTTATPAYVSENEFVPKHMSVKVASSVAGLAGATAVSTLESFTVTVNPNIEADWQSGSVAPYGFSSRGYEMSFEMTVRNEDDTYQDAHNSGASLALQVAAVNTDVTIGTSANPSLTITAPKMNITDWTRNEDLDAPVTETMTGTIHFSTTDTYAIRAVLVNLATAY